MILHQPYNNNDLNQKIENFWLLFNGKILVSTNKQWNEENYLGKSYSQWITMQYYFVLNLLILIYLDVKQTGIVNNQWCYYEHKYKLKKIEKCLACYGIKLSDALNTFNFPFNDNGSIGNDGIQGNFIIEDIISSPNTTNNLTTDQLISLINNPINCLNNIKSSCN